MASELINLGRYFTRLNPGTYETMFRSNHHLMECQFSRRGYNYRTNCNGAGPFSYWIYGIQGTCSDYADCVEQQWESTENAWDGVSEPIVIPQEERKGLLTRMAFLAHNTQMARPIRRGLKIKEILLCDPVPPPENCDVVRPPNLTGLCLDPNLEEDDENNLVTPCSDDMHCAPGETCSDWAREVQMTVREKVEELTEKPGTTCAGCHSTIINGFGYALGHFTSVGAYRENEAMHTTDKQTTGTGYFRYQLEPEENWIPIDVTGTTSYNNEGVTINGAEELSDFLVNTGRLEWCWSRQYFRFATGRLEVSADAESIEELAQSLRDGATLADGYKAITQLPQFMTLDKELIPNAEGEEP